MRIDLHTHSNRSDGTDAPYDLVMKAAAARLDVVAITDHDTTDGWDDASEAADRAGIRLVRGIELSTRNGDQSQHLLAYAPDPAHPELVDMLERGSRSRQGRIVAMVENLRATGVAIDQKQVARIADHGSIGRPHIADALVETGVCTSRGEAFERYLSPTTATYVARYRPTIEDAITTVAAAGGVTVMAHPWGRKTRVSEERFAELASVGLSGIEVDHQEHDQAARDALRSVAGNLKLVITGSSDYHGYGKVDHELGCNTTDPGEFDCLLSTVAP